MIINSSMIGKCASLLAKNVQLNVSMTGWPAAISVLCVAGACTVISYINAKYPNKEQTVQHEIISDKYDEEESNEYKIPV